MTAATVIFVVLAFLGVAMINAMAKKVKSAERVRAKLERSLSVAGPELEAGMNDAEDPVEVLLRDPDKYEKRMVARLNEAIKDKKVRQGWEKAKRRGSYKKSVGRAVSHYTEAAPRMTDNYIEGYPKRASVIADINAELASMPTDTTAQRILKSAAFQTKMHQAKVDGKLA